jgi:multidrug efflux pump subunit AcrA (membrane-fusion protein)
MLEDEIFTTIFGNNSNGNNSSGDTAAITLANLGQPLLEVYFAETDLQKVSLGYPVMVNFEALVGETFSGQIIAINPNLETVSNRETIVARVRLDTESYAKPASLPINLTATVEVISGQVLDTVLVPIEALVEIDLETYGVYVVENGEPQLKNVSIGLMDFTTAAITEGLTVGDTVVLAYQSTSGK